MLEPLADIQSVMGSISEAALSALNEATSVDEFPCPFADMYTKDEVLSPWDLSRPTDETPYAIRNNAGNHTSYNRLASETTESYFNRIYNKAGICSAQSSCCIAQQPQLGTCESEVYDDCDLGDNCAYPCENIKLGIVEGYKLFAQLYEKEQRMTADLGVLCPVDVGITCPTIEFKTVYANSTLVGAIGDYKVKITGTRESLVNLASTSVGDTIIEVEDFLCNMNVSFIERRYDEVKNDVCGTLFGGVAQIFLGLLMLGLSLEVVALLAHILAVRLRGLSEKEAALDIMDLDGQRSFRRANVYG